MITSGDVLARTTLLVHDHVPANFSDASIARAFSESTVGVAVNTAMFEHPGYVVALESLRVLLAGMCVGMRVEVRGHDRPIDLKPPFGHGHWLDALTDYRKDACAPISVGSLGTDCIARVGLGVSDARLDFELAADETSSWLTSSRRPPAWRGASIWSGAAAAVLAAADVYKRILVELRPDLRDQADFAPVRDFAMTPDKQVPEDLPSHLAVISAGAITNAAAFLLTRYGHQIELTVWDDDVLKVDNLNRYPLFDVQHLNLPKAEALASLELPLLLVKPRLRRFDADEPMPADTALIGADRVRPRWEVARRRLPRAIVGTTDHYLTLDSIHFWGQGGCPACLHHSDDAVEALIPTVSFVSFAAGLETAMYLVGPTAGVSRYSLTTTWLRPDAELARLVGFVPRSEACPAGCSETTQN